VFQGNYANFYNEYSTANTTPQDLRTALYRDGNTGALLHILMHVRDPNGDPNNPGLVVAYHRLSRHDQHFGQAPTPFNNKGLAFFGDVVNGQAPTTVHVPDTAFNSVGVGQIPTPARITQLFARDPQGQVFGPFAAAHGDVKPITTQQAIVVPNR
jgi:hypothetical protein